MTLEELGQDAALRPQNFSRYFADFKFQYRAEVQSAEVFLRTQSGDCDDYAILAASVLKAKGFSPRLISVRMPRQVHVVCYVEEVGGYLDFNQRARGNGLIVAGHDLREVAASVAEAFGNPWESVSEFTYGDGCKRLVRTMVPSDATRARSRGHTQAGKANEPS